MSIYLHDKADAHPLRMTTGFTLKLPAVAYAWQASVTGPEGFKLTYSRKGGLRLRKSWSADFSTALDYPQGDYSGAVSTQSYAVMYPGIVCYSHGPTAKDFLTSPDAPVSWGLSTVVDTGTIRTADIAGAPAASFVSSFVGSRGRVSPYSVIGMSPNSVVGKDTRKRVESTMEYPYRAIALLILEYSNDATARCTGFFISADTIATAGHCVADGPEVVDRVVVIPGNNAAVEPSPRR